MKHSVWEILGAIAVVGLAAGAAIRGLASVAADERRAEEAVAAVRQQLFDAVQPVNVTNCELKRIGDANDGGYVVCANLLDGAASGYSYGIAGTDNWGCEVSRTLKLPVHEYDCFDLRQPSCPDGQLVFHPECVGPAHWTEENDRVFDTVAAQVEHNGDAGKRLIMKMDVEGAEWDSFLATPDELLDRIDQLIVEFHGVEDARDLRTIEKLKRHFVFAHLHYNNYACRTNVAPFPAQVFEALLVNRRLAQTDGAPAPRGPLPGLDAPNDPLHADCN